MVPNNRRNQVYLSQPQFRLNNAEFSENDSNLSEDECKSLNASQSNIGKLHLQLETHTFIFFVTKLILILASPWNLKYSHILCMWACENEDLHVQCIIHTSPVPTRIENIVIITYHIHFSLVCLNVLLLFDFRGLVCDQVIHQTCC